MQALTILLPAAWTLVEDRPFMLARTASCRAVVALAWLYKRRGRPGWWVNGRWREGCTAQALGVLLLLASRRGFAVHETFDMARTSWGRPNIFAVQVIS